jgi:amidohydrolase
MPGTASVEHLVGLVDELSGSLTAVRRHLHAHPELAWEEKGTTQLVCDQFDSEGIEYERLPTSGLVATIGSGPPVVLLRADMDALPIDDVTGDPWRSSVEGVAHACGHDVHTSSLLGAAWPAQAERRRRASGQVRLAVPAGRVRSCRAARTSHRLPSALDGVDIAFALHCDPSLDVGQVGLREGAITGAADALTVRLSGRGGHTSRPHLTEDLTYAIGILSRSCPPRCRAGSTRGRGRRWCGAGCARACATT